MMKPARCSDPSLTQRSIFTDATVLFHSLSSWGDVENLPSGGFAAIKAVGRKKVFGSRRAVIACRILSPRRKYRHNLLRWAHHRHVFCGDWGRGIAGGGMRCDVGWTE